MSLREAPRTYQNPLLAYRHRTGAPRVTSWQKGVPFVPVISPCDQWHKNGRPSQQPHPTVRGDPWEPCGQGSMWPGQRKTLLGATGWLTIWRFPETWRALLGWLRGNTWAPGNQSNWKGKEVKVSGKKAEEPALQPCGEAAARGWSLCFAPTTMRLTQCTEAVLLGADALGTDPFLSPLSSHRSLHVAGALMAFKCLTRAHTMRTCLA